MPETPTGFSGLTGHRLVRRRTQRYLESLRWVIGTLVRVQPLRFTLILGLVAAGRGLQVVAFGGVMWFFSAVERDAHISVLGLTIEPRSGFWMALTIAGVAAAMIVASFFIYMSSRMSFYMAMAFAEHVITSVLNLDRGYPSRGKLAGSGKTSMQVLEVTNGRPLLFPPVNVLMMFPRHILLVIPALSGMIWIAGEVVVFLALLATPVIALNYVISHRVVVAQRTRKEVQGEFREAMRDTLDAIGDESRPVADRAALADALMAGEKSRASIHVFSHYLLSPRQSEFVSNVLAALAVAIIGFYLGYEALAGAMPLAQVIGFFIMLRVTIGGLTGATVSLTSYARFYGLIRIALEYLKSPLPPERFTGEPKLHAAKQDEPAPGALEEDVPVQRGVPVAVVSPAAINRFTQYFFAFALTQRSRHTTREKLNAATLRCTGALADPDALAANGLLSLDDDALRARLADTGVADIAPKAEKVRQAGRAGAKTGAADLARIALMTAVLSQADLVVVDPGLLEALPEDERPRWIGALSDRFIAVGYRIRGFSGCIAGESHAILLDFERAVAVVEAKDAVAAARFVEAGMRPARAEEPVLDEEELE